MSSDHYTTLGVSPDAPPEVIRAAYKVLAQKHHPDRNQGKDAEEVTARINEAYSVLSDPEKRSAYDAQRAAEVIATTVGSARNVPYAVSYTQRSVSTVTGEAEGAAFTLRFIPGQITTNEVWTETKMPTTASGPISIFQKPQVIPRQRIGAVTLRGNMLIEQTGSHIPLAFGQDIDVVQAYSSENSREETIALINRSTKQWFWIGTRVDAGKVVRPTKAMLLDSLLYAGVVGSIVVLVWLFLLRGHTLLTMAFFLFGGPLLAKVALPLQYRIANKIGVAIGKKIHSTVNPT